jgi:hypothetical protein
VLCAVGAAAVAATVLPAQADLVIDDFMTGAFTDSITGGSNIAQQAGGMLGGERDLGYQVNDNPFGQDLDVTIDPSFGLAFSTGTGLYGDFALDYDGAGEIEDDAFPFVQGPGLGMDFSAMDRITIDLLAIDLAVGVTVILQSFDDDGDVIGTASNAQTISAAGMSEFLFDDFVVEGGAPSFADVDRLIFQFNVDGETSVDLLVRQLGAGVPAPGAVALLALAGLGTRRRR